MHTHYANFTLAVDRIEQMHNHASRNLEHTADAVVTQNFSNVVRCFHLPSKGSYTIGSNGTEPRVASICIK